MQDYGGLLFPSSTTNQVTHPNTPTGENVAFSYISCPADPGQALGIKLPFLVLVVKSVRA
jgi:hypothetical protein